jgi:hypothetical protein
VALTVLSTWREKVFALLVQNRGRESIHTAETARFARELAEETAALKAKETEATILRNACVDKDTELRRLQAQVDVAMNAVAAERALRLEADARRATAEKAMTELCAVIPRAESDLMQKTAECNAALGRLGVLSRRVSFAVERAKTCSYLLSARRTGRGGRAECETDEATADADAEPSVASALENEVEQLRRERDYLIEKGAEHDRTFAARVDDARQRFADRVTTAETAAAQGQADAARTAEALAAAEKQLADAAVTADDRAETATTERERSAALKQRELDHCRSERDAAVAELERTVVEKAADTAKHKARVVELEHALLRARETTSTEHRSERHEWERQVAQLGDQLEKLSADRNTVAAGLEQANFRLWSKSHDDGARPRTLPPPVDRRGTVASRGDSRPWLVEPRSEMSGVAAEDSPRGAVPIPAASVGPPRRSADPSDDGHSEVDTETTAAALYTLSQNLLRSSAGVAELSSLR